LRFSSTTIQHGKKCSGRFLRLQESFPSLILSTWIRITKVSLATFSADAKKIVVEVDFFWVDTKKVTGAAGKGRGTEAGRRPRLTISDRGLQISDTGLFWPPPKKSPF
jgi:hypothetical protein